jgi:aminomethyltransferase
MSPSLKKGIGMAYVRTPDAVIDKEIFVEIRDKRLKARIVKMPFYKFGI